jgi:hypothetical protein
MISLRLALARRKIAAYRTEFDHTGPLTSLGQT